MLALVTGASSGIGLQYATQLARDYQCDLLLVSNQEKELSEVAAELAAKYNVKTVAHYADLSLPDAAENVHDWCTENGYEVASFEAVEDGAGNMESAKSIFGDYYETFWALNSNQEKREDMRLHYTADYVKKNNMAATVLQDFGWPAVNLPE